ncbi:hypothetical protein XM38_035910 [Halomicronema hongdechloris C2206]|uniref:Uncharacterized protein n=1 Tax=Halomicronema hongdechloris C2206 TaxID=1641165 RepID=A0A1Z3HQP9_9CYAN|nr:hypothetical protein XM38_035910 [Halomicronema hongdechloris C2206]
MQHGMAEPASITILSPLGYTYMVFRPHDLLFRELLPFIEGAFHFDPAVVEHNDAIAPLQDSGTMGNDEESDGVVGWWDGGSVSTSRALERSSNTSNSGWRTNMWAAAAR